ncbi:hypothetical protein PanWU01x14_176070 [Parasponia andersonii]|uniref:Uncharacterized protein n=1 Tax=Parasponia andersonii TaxID=3476 RepID=A0A2P5C837_PARAD|nr:hypothetical protein PanWU01x14_176070 [Parasponia andersonii]
MKSMYCTSPITALSNPNSLISHRPIMFASPSHNFLDSSLQIRILKRTQNSFTASRSQSRPSSQMGSRELENGEDPDAQVEDLRVPDHWLVPSRALEESEWLRVTLHKWLDDEYCPEATNVEISKVASYSYYKCLIEKQIDLGEILLKMARELETISYQESFHGAFSSANAAINLIAQRIEQA